MPTTAVKCNSCNIVISEVLAYIQNKLDVMDQESLFRVCIKAFTSMEIEEAKSLLHESLASKKRLKTRRREGKVQRDLEDIIVVFHEVDPNVMQIFVARNLYKLPPVHLDHVDPTNLLKDIQILKNEFKELKDCFATKDQFEALKMEVSNFQRASLINNFDCNVNKKRGACLMDSFIIESGPNGLSPITDFEKSQLEQDILYYEAELANLEVPSHPSEPATKTKPVILSERQASCEREREQAPPSPQPSPPPPTPPSNATPPQQTAEDIKTIALINKDKDTGDTYKWNQVIKKKQQKRQNNGFNSTRSKGCEDVNFKAAQNQAPLFLTNVHRDVSVKDIVDFVQKKDW